MSMTYDDAAADRLEAVYLGHDVVAQRADTLATLNITPGMHILDIGSGPGFLAEDMARATGPTGRVLGVDLSPQLIARATTRASVPWLSYREADAAALPLEDASFDLVVSTQVAEYVPDIDAFCTEAARVLKPGGLGHFMATDWGAISWATDAPERMAAVLEAFEPHCADPRLPQRFAQRLEAAGLTVTNVRAFPIVTLTPQADSYARMLVPFIQTYVSKAGTMPQETLDAWAQEQETRAKNGTHFFMTSRVVFSTVKA